MFPAGEQELKNSHHQLVKLARILGTNKEHLIQTWGKLKEPELWHGDKSLIPRSLTKDEITQIQELELPKLKVLPYERDTAIANRECSGLVLCPVSVRKACSLTIIQWLPEPVAWRKQWIP